MYSKTQVKNNYWNDSKYLFFTPKLSLQGRNVFPQINDINHIFIHKDPPFLNILKKPLMGVYEKTHIKSNNKPVYIVGLPKQVDVRQIKTGGLKRVIKEVEEILQSKAPYSYKESRKTQSSSIGKYQIQKLKSSSKKSIPANLINMEGIHYYYIGVGNNSQLMESIINRRQGWYQTTNSIYHFRWEQTRSKYQNSFPLHKQMLNHLPNHQTITDKGNLLQNLREYCEKNEQYMYKIVPVSFILDFSKDQIIQDQIKKFVQFYWDCTNQESRIDYNPEVLEIETKQKQRLCLSPEKSSRKKKINNTNISVKLRAESPKKNFNNKYETYKAGSARVIKSKIEMVAYDSLKKKQQIKILYKSLINKFKPMYNFQDMSTIKKDNQFVAPIISQVYGETSLWLLKPSDLNRGRGIHLFNNIEELGDLLRQELIRNEKGSFIVQKYLQKPLLIKERKFDIRVWVMVTQNKQIFFFKQGYIRMSSQKFTLDSKNFFTHLTNNAVQKHAANYGEFQQGNILPLKELYQNGYIAKKDLYSQMKRHILISMKASQTKMYTPNDKNQTISMTNSSVITSKKTVSNKTKYFQIFGYDFMVDTNKQIWLIQINTNPCIQLSNKWLKIIIPRMLDDAMKLTLDKVFANKKNQKDEIQPFKVQGYCDNQNMWQILSIYQDQA